MSEEQKIRVVIADDQELVRAGFAMVIGSQPDMAVAAQARDGAEAVALAETLHPDVVLMDVRMPGMDGIEGDPADQVRCGIASLPMERNQKSLIPK